MKTNAYFRFLLAVFASLMVLLPGYAQGPKLEELSGAASLPQTFQVDKPYTIALRYTDPKGDPIKKSDAKFIDQGPNGTVAKDATAIRGSDTSQGVTIEWELNGLSQGAHVAHFEVKGTTETVRYPEDAKSNYQFTVESLTTKIIIFVVVLLVALLALPLIVYLIARAVNPRGDPSRAARMGLLLGVVASLAAFVLMFFSALFVGPYSWLGWGIMGILGLAAIVVLLRR